MKSKKSDVKKQFNGGKRPNDGALVPVNLKNVKLVSKPKR